MFAEIQRGDIHPKPDDRFHGTPLYMGTWSSSRFVSLSHHLSYSPPISAPELWGNEPFEGKKADGTLST